MSIGRIDFQGAIIRTGDYSAVKQNEDNKPQTDQAAFQVQFSREADEKSQSVSHTSKSDPQKFKFDAKEKGNGSYESPDGDHKKKKDKHIIAYDEKKVEYTRVCYDGPVYVASDVEIE